MPFRNGRSWSWINEFFISFCKNTVQFSTPAKRSDSIECFWLELVHIHARSIRKLKCVGGIIKSKRVRSDVTKTVAELLKSFLGSRVVEYHDYWSEHIYRQVILKSAIRLVQCKVFHIQLQHTLPIWSLPKPPKIWVISMSHANESELKCVFCSINQKDNVEIPNGILINFLYLVNPS